MSTTALCSFISPRAQRIARAGSSTDLDVRGSIHLEKMLMLDEEINDLTMLGGINQTRRIVKRDVFHTWSLFTNLLSAQICIQCSRRILVKRATYRCSACKSMVHLRCRVHAGSAVCQLKQPVKQNTCTEYDVGEQYSSTEFLSLPKHDPTKRKGKVQLQSQYSKWSSKNHLQKNRSDTESALKMKYRQVKGGIKRTMRSFRSKVNKAKETLSESFSRHEAFRDGGDSFLSFIENERKCEEMEIFDSESDRGSRQFKSNRGCQGFRRNHSKPKLESETQAKERELDQEMDCLDDLPSHQRDFYKRHEFQCDHDIDLILDRLDEVEVKVQRLEAKIPEELQCWRKLVQKIMIVESHDFMSKCIHEQYCSSQLKKHRNEDEMDTCFKNKTSDDDIQTNNSASENKHSFEFGSTQDSDSDSHNSDPDFISHNSGLSAKEASIRSAKQMDLPLQPRQLNFRLQKDTEEAENDGIKEKITSTPISGCGIFQSPNGQGIFPSPDESGKSAIRVKNITHFVMDNTETTIVDHRRAQTENGFGLHNRIETQRVWQSNCNTRQKEYKDTRNMTGQHRDTAKTEEGKGDLLMYKDDEEEHRKRKDAFKQGLQIVLQNYAKGKLDYDTSVKHISQARTWSREANKVDDDYRVKEEYTTAKTSPNPLISSTVGQDKVKFSTLDPGSPFSVTFRKDESLSSSNISVKCSPKRHSRGTDGGNLHSVFISPDQNKSGKSHANNVEAHLSRESIERERVCTEEISLTCITDLPVVQTYNSFSRGTPVESKTCRSDSSLAGAAETYMSKFYASKEYFEHQISELKGTCQSAYQKSEQYFEQQSSNSKGTSQTAYQKSKEYFEKMNLEHIESNQGNIDKKGKESHDRHSLKRQSSGGYGKPVMVISPNPGNESQDKSPSSFSTSMGLQSLIEDLERHLPFSTRSFPNLSIPREEATKKLQECNYADKDYKEQGKGVSSMKHWSSELNKHNLDVKLNMETGTGEIASTKNKVEVDGSMAQSNARLESNGDSCGFERSKREMKEIVPKRIPDKISDIVLYMTDSGVQTAKYELQESANESEERFSGRSVVDKPPCPGKTQHKLCKKSQNIGIQATEFGVYRGKERSSNAKYHFLNSTGMVKICSPKLKLLSETLSSESHAINANAGTNEHPLENELQTVSSNSRHLCGDNQDKEKKTNKLKEDSDSNLSTDESDEFDSDSEKIEESNASQCSSDEGQWKQQRDDKKPQKDNINYEELPNGWEITCKKGVITEHHNLVDIHNSTDKGTDSMEISSSLDTNCDFVEKRDVDGMVQQDAEMMQHIEVNNSVDQNRMTKEMSLTSESEQQSEESWNESQETEEMAQLDQFNEILDEGLQNLDPIMQWVQNQEFNLHVPEFQMILTPKMDPCDYQAHFRNMSPSERGFQLPDMIPFQENGIEPTFVPSPDIGGDNKAVIPALEGCNKADTLQDETIYFSM